MKRTPESFRKYRNKRTDGYHSAREAKRAQELILLEKAGEIVALKEQIRYELIPPQEGERPVHYIADFGYFDTAKGEYVVEDSKGFKTPDYIIKRKLMLWVHKIRVREV